MATREITEGLQHQGPTEAITYRLTTTAWSNGTNPSAGSADIYSIDALGNFTDVTSTNMSGSASVSGEQVTLPQIAALTAGTRYLVATHFTVSGDDFTAISWIQCDKK